MEIKTKYDLRQEVWWMAENRTHSGEIKRITLNIEATQEGDKQYTNYRILDYQTMVYDNISEYKLFPTKEELLKSL